MSLLFDDWLITALEQVFYWYVSAIQSSDNPAAKLIGRFSVPHDRLFLDALERDLKREKMGLETTTAVEGEPARSFRLVVSRLVPDQDR